MKKLSINEQKKYYGGAISGAIWTAIYKSVNVFTDLGRYLGSSIRRFSERNYCNY